MRADALRNRERLVDVAQEAFARNGVDTSLEEIARDAGVGIGTLYRRFPSRDDLIAAVLSERYLLLSARADEFAAEQPPMVALRAWLVLLLDHMSLYRGLSLAVKEAIHDRSTALGMTCAQMVEAGNRLMARCRNAESLRADVTFSDVLSMCSGIAWAAERRAEKPDETPSLDRHLLLDILLKGIKSD